MLSNGCVRMLTAGLAAASALAASVSAQAATIQPPPLGSQERAVRDFFEHKPLPGMPNLDKPVYVGKGEIICRSTGALRNPDRENLLLMGVCIIVDHPLRVMVYPPPSDDIKSYVEHHMFSYVEVAWSSGKMSDASVGSGYVFVQALRN